MILNSLKIFCYLQLLHNVGILSVYIRTENIYLA